MQLFEPDEAALFYTIQISGSVSAKARAAFYMLFPLRMWEYLC